MINQRMKERWDICATETALNDDRERGLILYCNGGNIDNGVSNAIELSHHLCHPAF
jgi:hypothetical protein